MTVDSPISIKSVQVIWSRATTKQTNKQIALKSSTAIRKSNGKQLFLSQSPFFISKLDIYLEKKLTKNLTECLNIATYWWVIVHLLALLNSKKKISQEFRGSKKICWKSVSFSHWNANIFFLVFNRNFTIFGTYLLIRNNCFVYQTLKSVHSYGFTTMFLLMMTANLSNWT